MLLSTFISAYTPPAAVLDVHSNTNLLVDRNGSFTAISRRHGHLVDELVTACLAGYIRTRTTFDDGSSVRWTLTTIDGGQVVALAADSDVSDEHAPVSPSPATPRASSSLVDQDKPSKVPFDWTCATRLLPLASGGGEMGHHIRALDWSTTSIGLPTTWSPTLITILSIILHSDFPATISWSSDLLLFYNDAYISVLGPRKHPHSLGQPFRKVWASIWNDLKPLAERTIAGEDWFVENGILLLDRNTDPTPPVAGFRSSTSLYMNNGDTFISPPSSPTSNDADSPASVGEYIEETYFTWAFIPLYTLSGTVEGIYNPCHESTGKVRLERRLNTLATLATRLSTARTQKRLLKDTCEVLGGLEADVPYVAVYAVEEASLIPGVTSPAASTEKISSVTATSITLLLQDAIGIPIDGTAAPAVLNVPPTSFGSISAASGFCLDLSESVHQRELRLHDHPGIPSLLKGLPFRGSVPSRPRRAASLPIVQGGQLVGLIIVYLCSAVPVDGHMLNFLELLSRQVSTSASMVASYEHEVQKLEEMAALDRAKTTFFTNISHELRTPLTLILGPLTELLNLPSLANSAKNHLTIANRNARRLLHLVNTIMDFATAEAGRLTFSFRGTMLGPRTADLASAFRSAAEVAGLEYVVDVDGVPQDTRVWVDPDKYEKIVYNLLSNALKYTHAGSVRVRVYVEGPKQPDWADGSDEGRFVLEISDTGVGIPRTELGKIFEKFHRAKNASSGRRIEGTGIGLSFVRELVRGHGGDVTVESEIGKGCRFRVKLPLGRGHLPMESIVEEESGETSSRAASMHNPVTTAAAANRGWMVEDSGLLIREGLSRDEQPETSEPAKSSPALAGGQDVIWQPLPFGTRSRARILIADDNSDMRQYFTSLLGKYCDVIPVADGAKAYQELITRRKEFDLVVSDDMMPHMTGSELLDALRADDDLRALPFIMVSARAGDEARLEGLARGADDYLSKPFQARELLLRVQTQLQAASLRNELEHRVNENLRQRDESRESFARLCARLQVGVHRADPQGQITWANHKYIYTLGLDEASWNDWSDVIHPEDVPVATAAWTQAMETGKGYPNPIEMRVRLAPVPEHYIDIIYDLQPEYWADASGTGEQLRGWVGVFSDVSSLRALQRKAVEIERTHTAEAERNRELQEQFIDITCHELRNPLNAIYNSAALLGESLARIGAALKSFEQAEGDEALKSQLAVIKTELEEDIDSASTILLCARHQKRITDDVLNMSKLSAGLINLVMADFMLWDEVNNTVRMFRDDVNARGVVLELDRDPSLDSLAVGHVKGDSGRFIQVIVNLISNAIKFTETAPKRTVRVRVGAVPVPPDVVVHHNSGTDMEEHLPAWPSMDNQEDLLPMCQDQGTDQKSTHLWIYVAVADSGHGMTQEEQDHVFQRFKQANARTYGEFGGHGLGLYVSRMLVELHGGRIHLQSRKGVGTVLRFFILVERSLSPPPMPHRQSSETSIFAGSRPGSNNLRSVAATDRKMRILVVEDNLVNQRILVKLLSVLECDTQTCKDGQVCLDLLTATAPTPASGLSFDLILMDLEMPVLDGLAATRRIRELEDAGVLPHSVPIVAVSGNARSEWTDRARNSGMDGFLRKPYDKTELQELLDRWRPRAKS